ncbi:AMP-binding protein [Pseudalkalibacillus berkeleyi]|uniref:acetate--CoA ligase n=1 Tax=Pseudalkalibacillus berkeleyi TaxID=1069813 RepID=A0ABS9GXL0_9BACL|nr:AMP-binding protein [Pseudalkalibacillus berkeleyi]MCF6137522.1 AMP-binding protein [Pseudalkalibacillus berkeleyi]
MSLELYGSDQVIWRPNQNQIDEANLTAFTNRYGVSDYQALIKKAAEDQDWFYNAINETFHFQWDRPFDRISESSNGAPFTEWFKGGYINIYKNCVEKHLTKCNTKNAIVWEGEDGSKQGLTYQELDEHVSRFALGLQRLGVGYGDRIGIFLPPIIESAIALYACAKLGAIAVPMFSGYGADAVTTRLNDSECKVLITADGSIRKGKVSPMKEIADRAVDLSPSVEHVVVVNHTHTNFTKRRLDRHYENVLASKGATLITHETKASDPYLIIYTSGTTGKPKGTVHTHSSFIIKTAIDMYFCFDVKEDAKLFWMTDIGWIMGPWLLIGANLFHCTAVLYEGDVNYPQNGRILQLIEDHRLTHIGMAPTVVRTLRKTHSDQTLPSYDTSSLKIIGSTGEAIDQASWTWLIEQVGESRCPIINYSGGTEAGGGIIGCYPTMPLKASSFHGPLPGIDPEVVDQDQQPVRNKTGELIVQQPFVGMTKSFWQDDDRYLNTYWNKWPGVWVHGDLVSIDDLGYWYIKGRADDTIKVAGKRIGPTEIEEVLTNHDRAKEAAVIGIPDDIKGQSIIGFVTLENEGEQLDKGLIRNELVNTVAEKLGKPLKPTFIFFVKDFPRTQSRKIVRRVIKNVFLNEQIGDISTIANPNILVEFTSDKLLDKGVT